MSQRNLQTRQVVLLLGAGEVPAIKAPPPQSEAAAPASVHQKHCRDHPLPVSLPGPAALTCAETLRQEGFAGRILMVTRENHLPYDKTQLSKVQWVGDLAGVGGGCRRSEHAEQTLAGSCSPLLPLPKGAGSSPGPAAPPIGSKSLLSQDLF